MDEEQKERARIRLEKAADRYLRAQSSLQSNISLNRDIFKTQENLAAAQIDARNELEEAAIEYGEKSVTASGVQITLNEQPEVFTMEEIEAWVKEMERQALIDPATIDPRETLKKAKKRPPRVSIILPVFY